MLSSDVIRFAQVHRLWPVLASTAIVAVVSALLGGFLVPIPSLSDGVSTGIPFRRELPLLSGVFLTAPLTSALGAYEDTAGPRYFRVKTIYLLALTTVTCLISFSVQALATGGALGASFVRSLLVWFGLALLSSRLIGQSLAWVLPVASAFPLVWFSNNDWWDWTATPAADLISWGMAAASLALGTAAIGATRWRLSPIIRWCRSVRNLVH